MHVWSVWCYMHSAFAVFRAVGAGRVQGADAPSAQGARPAASTPGQTPCSHSGAEKTAAAESEGGDMKAPKDTQSQEIRSSRRQGRVETHCLACQLYEGPEGREDRDRASDGREGPQVESREKRQRTKARRAATPSKGSAVRACQRGDIVSRAQARGGHGETPLTKPGVCHDPRNRDAARSGKGMRRQRTDRHDGGGWVERSHKRAWRGSLRRGARESMGVRGIQVDTPCIRRHFERAPCPSTHIHLQRNSWAAARDPPERRAQSAPGCR